MNSNNLKAVMEDFKNYAIVIKNLSENSIETVLTSVKLFLKFINTYKFNYDEIEQVTLNDLRTITNTDVYHYIFDLAENNTANSTRTSRTEHIKMFFQYLYKIKHSLFSNQIANIKNEKRLKQNMPNYLSLEDAKKMSNLYKDSEKIPEIRTNAIINLCLNCGMRINEVIELKISDFNFNNNTFLIHGKGNKERTGYLNELTKESVLKYLEIRKKLEPERKCDKDILFLSIRNKKLNYRTIHDYVKRSYTKANIDNSEYSLHTLRHTCATILYKSGTDINIIKELLGHSSINTTEIYTHVHNEKVKESMLESPLAHFTLQEVYNY